MRHLFERFKEGAKYRVLNDRTAFDLNNARASARRQLLAWVMRVRVSAIGQAQRAAGQQTVSVVKESRVDQPDVSFGAGVRSRGAERQLPCDAQQRGQGGWCGVLRGSVTWAGSSVTMV